MKALHIYKWLMVALASLLISFQAQALPLDPFDAAASTATLREVNNAFGTSFADLMRRLNGGADSRSADQGGLLNDFYDWNMDVSDNSCPGGHNPQNGPDNSNVPPRDDVASVSEPGTLMLMSLGLLGLAYSRKRRNS
ncbi:MAG: PEP-CTERM sorting domain-containing protein [Chromatiales bacterium]|jgi:hypothetical protein